MPAHDDTTLYDILMAYQQIYEEALHPVLAGREYTSLDLLLRGVGPASMNISTDFSLWAESMRATGAMQDKVEVPMVLAYHDPSYANFRALRDVMTSPYDRKRMLYWLAVCGDTDAADRLYNTYHRVPDIRGPFVEGLRAHAYEAKRTRVKEWYPGVELKILTAGVRTMVARFSRIADLLDAIDRWFERSRPADARPGQSAEKAWLRDLVSIARTRAYERELASEVEDAEVEDRTQKVAKRYDGDVPGQADDDEHAPVAGDSADRYSRNSSGLLIDWHTRSVVDESRPSDVAEQPETEVDAEPKRVVTKAVSLKASGSAFPHVVVLPDLQPGKSATGDLRGDNDLLRHLAPISGRYVNLACAPMHMTEIAAGLGEAWPHARGVIDRILRDVRPGEPIRLRPTLIVGGPGSGKTSLAREIGVALNLSTTVFPCASVADGSFGGTGAQWSTRRASTPLEAIRQSGEANPLIVMDEIEKTGSGSHNGSLLSALLPMLERHTAKSYFEVGIERNADLSHVGFLATANSLAGVPAPLLDRFRVLEMPDAGPQHLGDLARRIVGDIARDNGLDPAWTPPLAHDELGVIRRIWKGGSLRRLRTAIQATLDAREQHMRGRPM